MAHETSEPKNNAIFFWMFASVGALVAIVPLLQSYFYYSMGEELEEKVFTAGTEEYAQLEEAARARLANAPTSVAAAIENLSGENRPAVIAPTASSDLGAVEGWAQLKHEADKAAAEEAVAARAAREADEAAAAAAALAAGEEGVENTVTPLPDSPAVDVMDATNDPDNR